MLRVVLDANVFVSAAIRPAGPPGRVIARFLRGSDLQVVVSPAIVEEVLRALTYPKVRRLVRGTIDVEDWFEDLVVLADLVVESTPVHGVCEDPDDDKYLAAAVDGRADYLVTGDSRLLRVREFSGVRVVTPREFVDLLG